MNTDNYEAFDAKIELSRAGNNGTFAILDVTAQYCSTTSLTTLHDTSEAWAGCCQGPLFGYAYRLQSSLPLNFDRAHPIFTAAEEIGLSSDHLYGVLLYVTLRLGDFDVDDPPCAVTILPAINVQLTTGDAL